MQEEIDKKTQIANLIFSSFKVSERERNMVEDILSCEKLDLDRLKYILENSIAFKLDQKSIMAFVNYQYYKVEPEKAKEYSSKMSEEEKKIIDEFITIKDIKSLTPSENIDDIRRMFIVMSRDTRVVIIKLFCICYDISVLQHPLSPTELNFLKLVKEVHVPLSERLGLDKLKSTMNDHVIRLEHPAEYRKLLKEIKTKQKENEEQLEISKRRIQEILDDLKIDGHIESRIKHVSSIFNKLHNKNLRLDQIYDILAIRVIVNNVEECYSVLGRIHGIYKPMAGRVKDYIANPKPNGYKSLHTTIIVENQHPLEVQIRTDEMHKESEFGLYAHWLYKENKDKKNEFDKRLTWFRQTVENAKNMSDEEFIETLKSDLYDGIVVVQTPKGRVLEFPEGASVIDFAYAIHTDIGNKCIGAKINGKLKPFTTQLKNGDIVEILTNAHSKGPSRDWLKFVKTAGARSKIKAFFKNELRDENIRLGKSMFNQALQERGMLSSQVLTDENVNEILKRYNYDTFDEVLASIGSGSITSAQVASRFQTLVNKDENDKQKPNAVVHLKRNKDGVLVDGDSGMLVRFAGCCNPIEGDDIVGYISRGKGVAIHRQNCSNLKYLESERLIDAKWQVKEDATFTAAIKVIATKSDNNIGRLTNLITGLKIAIKGFEAKDIGDSFVCTLIIDVKNKEELNSAMNSIRNMKNILEVYRSER